jgi:hypothetical protein
VKGGQWPWRQVSASEAGEPKRLLVLRSADWRIEESVPLSLGRRHFTFTYVCRCTLFAPACRSDPFPAQNAETSRNFSKLLRQRISGIRVGLAE